MIRVARGREPDVIIRVVGGGDAVREVSALGGGFAAPEGDGAQWVAQLAHVVARLAAAETMQAVTSAAVSHGRDALEAAVVALMVRDGDVLRLAGAQGVRAGVEDGFAVFGVQEVNPASEAVREGRTVMLSTLDDIPARYPVLAQWMPPGRSLVCLPLQASGESVGVIGLTFEHNWLPGPRELDLLTTFAYSCAQAIRRIRAVEEARSRALQQQFLAAASAELARSLDYRETLSNVAHLAVPDLADWCTVSLVHEDTLTTVAVAHQDPGKVAWAWELQERFPPELDSATGPGRVIRTGSSELYSEINDELLRAGARDSEHLQLTRDLALRSAILAPLAARGRTLGVLTLLRAAPGASFTADDLMLAEEVARRAGIAIDNAELFTHSREVAELLQRAVLPAPLRPPPGWSLASAYDAGGRGEVGGDFYDAIIVGAGGDDTSGHPPIDGAPKMALVIGDVMGHGVAAAAAMAQLRAAVRAFVSVDPAPEHVVSRLDHMFSRLDLGGLATLVYALLDPTRGELALVNAGHLPPLLVDHAGAARFLHAAPQPMLGAGAAVGMGKRSVTRWPLTAQDTFVLYTDGLIERRGENIDTGMERLLTHCSIVSAAPLQAKLDSLIATLNAGDSDSDSDDDVTALAARYDLPHGS